MFVRKITHKQALDALETTKHLLEVERRRGDRLAQELAAGRASIQRRDPATGRMLPKGS